jgi:glycosyltransferase involved in cell wall biosynthesis
VLTLTYSLADQNFATTKSIGILNLSLQLLEHLAQRPEITSLTVLGNEPLMTRLKLPSTAKVVLYNEAIAGRTRRIGWDQWGVYRAAVKAGHEWLLLPKGFASFLRPCPVSLALYVHDAMWDYYDHFHRHGLSWLERWYFRQCFRANLKRARVIFTNSHFTRTEVERVAQRWQIPVPRVDAVGLGFSAPAEICPKTGDRIIALASTAPHKRTNTESDYLSRWQVENSFAGTVDWVGRWPQSLARFEYPGWRYHERLPESEFRRLLSQARVLLFFSEYEGFGMPPVEAVLAGVCPVYSDIPVTREVMGGLGCPFSNEDYGSFAHALNAALKVPASQLGEWAGLLLKQHCWDRVAAKVVAGCSGSGGSKSNLLI